MLGFAITALFVAYQQVTDGQSPLDRNPAFMVMLVILCPPSLLSLPFTDAEAGSTGFYLLWTFIAVLNAALYGSIRALITRRLKKVD